MGREDAFRDFPSPLSLSPLPAFLTGIMVAFEASLSVTSLPQINEIEDLSPTAHSLLLTVISMSHV